MNVLDNAGRATAKQLQLKVAVGNGNNQYKHDNERASKKDKAKSTAAKSSHVPVTARARAYAARNEKQIAQMIGGQKTDDNLPMDNVVTDAKGNPKLGVEIKTLTVNSNDKITMHPGSLDRKQKWGRDNKAAIHTVVVDDRKSFGTRGYSGHRLYHKEGVGSYRLSTMTKVTSTSHLRKLLGIK
jgi:hypothetical protein